MRGALIVAIVSAAVNKAMRGELNITSGAAKAAHLVRHAVDPAVDPAAIDDVIISCDYPGRPAGRNIDRHTVLARHRSGMHNVDSGAIAMGQP